MEVGEDVDEGSGVVLLQAVPQVLQHSQHNVHGVAQVQCNQDVVEAVSGLKNIKAEGDVSYWNGLHVFSILGACASVLSIQTLILRHNSIIYQNCWYEVKCSQHT